MSHDDSTTPAAEQAATPHKSNGRPGLAGNKPLIIGLALALIAGVLAFFLLRGGGDDNSANCVADEVLLTTAPAMKDLVDEAIKAVEKSEECITFKVTEGSVKDVVSILNDPDGVMPELWVPDSPTWKGQLTAAGWTGTPIAEVIAQTPVGLVSGPAAKAPASWTEALRSGRLAMADPSVEGASALALIAPFAEMKTSKLTVDEIKQMTVPSAQSFGERNVEGEDTATDLSAIGATSTQLVPATEAAYLAARRGNDQVTLVAPKSGVPMLQFPIISVKKGSGSMFGGGGRLDLSDRAGRALAHWFSSNEGKAAVTDAEFRTADAQQLDEGIGLQASKTLPAVRQEVVDDALRNWRVLSIPSSLLALFDLSVSMRQPLGDKTRLAVASTASLTALDVLPDIARVGTWGFSKRRGDNNEPWEEFIPMRRLDADAGDGKTQREVLREDQARYNGRMSLGTGLFDTLVDAYKEALAQWDPAYFNAVVVFTDGAQDDTSEITIDGLVQQLQSMLDPSRPVKVVVIGMGEQADSPEMNQIAQATNGQYYLVTKPDDILGVLAQALLNR